MDCNAQAVSYIFLFQRHYLLSCQLVCRLLVVRNGEGTSAITMIRNVVRVVLYNGCGHLLSVECGRAGVTMKKLLPRHMQAVFCIIVARPCGQGMISGYHYSVLV